MCRETRQIMYLTNVPFYGIVFISYFYIKEVHNMSDLNIKTDKNGNELSITLGGRLDTNTSPELEEIVESSLDGMEKVYFDMADLAYISSAGLRVLLTALQTMEDQTGDASNMILRNVGVEIMDVFEITGFIDDLTIEE